MIVSYMIDVTLSPNFAIAILDLGFVMISPINSCFIWVMRFTQFVCPIDPEESKISCTSTWLLTGHPTIKTRSWQFSNIFKSNIIKEGEVDPRGFYILPTHFRTGQLHLSKKSFFLMPESAQRRSSGLGQFFLIGLKNKLKTYNIISFPICL